MVFCLEEWFREKKRDSKKDTPLYPVFLSSDGDLTAPADSDLMGVVAVEQVGDGGARLEGGGQGRGVEDRREVLLVGEARWRRLEEHAR